MAGIYIHIPFCKQACHYCDFHFSTSLKKKDELIKSIIKELFLRKNEIDEVIETIYFGGGTPSLLSQTELSSILNAIHEYFQVINRPEVTLEANPDDLSEDILIRLSKSPINRLSIGIQSFFEADLKLMNRAHNASEALDCIETSKRYFDNISIDLIYGIPGMSRDRWQKNLDLAVSLNIPHISSYALTVEPKTALKKMIEQGKVKPVDEELAQTHYFQLIDTLDKAGFVNYEFSNFGKPNFFSKNNTAYWQGKSYLGVGPSAHSFNGNQRSWNVRNNTKYIKELANNKLPIERETLTIDDRYNEYIMTGLRTIWGINLDKIETDFSKKHRDYLMNQTKTLMDKGLLELNENTLKVTRKGKFLNDGITSDLFLVNLS